MQNLKTEPRVSVGSKMKIPIKEGLDIQAVENRTTRSSLIEKICATYLARVKNGDWNINGLKSRLQDALLKYQNLYEKYERKVQAYFELEQEHKSLKKALSEQTEINRLQAIEIDRLQFKREKDDFAVISLSCIVTALVGAVTVLMLKNKELREHLDSLDNQEPTIIFG